MYLRERWKKLRLTGDRLAAGATGPISEHFHVSSEAKLILPTSMYLVGYVAGPMIWGPLSESYGRKWVMIGSFAFFTVFAIASAVAPNFAALVVFRLMVGLGGSCAISVVGGVCADVYHDPVARGRSMAIFMVCWMAVRLCHGGLAAYSIAGCYDFWSDTWAAYKRLHCCGELGLGVLDWGHLCGGVV